MITAFVPQSIGAASLGLYAAGRRGERATEPWWHLDARQDLSSILGIETDYGSATLIRRAKIFICWPIQKWAPTGVTAQRERLTQETLNNG